MRPAQRARGIGRELLRALARVAEQRGCGRMEWAVLDWNEPALRFYQSLDARQMKEWIIHRLTPVEIAKARGGSRIRRRVMKRYISWFVCVAARRRRCREFAADPASAAAVRRRVRRLRRSSRSRICSRGSRRRIGLVVLDVRTPAEFAAGHVPGARNMSHDQLAASLGELADAARQGRGALLPQRPPHRC